MGRHSFRVIGVRPDGREGIVLFSNSRRRADALARYVVHRNRDWNVRIEMLPSDPHEPPVVIGQTEPKADQK